jgi:hypothetical protein
MDVAAVASARVVHDSLVISTAVQTELRSFTPTPMTATARKPSTGKFTLEAQIFRYDCFCQS